MKYLYQGIKQLKNLYSLQLIAHPKELDRKFSNYKYFFKSFSYLTQLTSLELILNRDSSSETKTGTLGNNPK